MTHYAFGKWNSGENLILSVEDAQNICRQARELRQVVAQIPLDISYQVLSAVRERWLDPAYPPRKLMQEQLPKVTGFSAEMIKLGLDELGVLFDPEYLEQLQRIELREIPRNPDFFYDPCSRQLLSWHALGVVFHVLSGNVFLVGPSSLILGLLTGNVSILKMSSQETIFMPTLMRSIQQVEEELGLKPLVSRTVALVEFSSSEKLIMALFKKQVEALVIWGGEEAVRSYRNDVPASCRIVVFGPKLSLAVVSEGGLRAQGLESCAEKLAWEISIWDQAACTAPQVCYVQGEELAQKLAFALGSALEKMQKSLPAGRLDTNQAAEIRKLRTVQEIAAFRTGQPLVESAGNLNWTVIVDKGGELSPSPLHRTIKLIPFGDFEEVLQQVNLLRSYVQTVGIYANLEEFLELSAKLGECGVLRTCPLGEMGGGKVHEPHDGAYDLPQLQNLVSSILPAEVGDQRVFQRLPPRRQAQIIDKRLRETFAAAQQHPFYRELFRGLTVQGLGDLAKLPILEKTQIQAHLASAVSLLPKEQRGGYVTRTGGTTGAELFSYFNGDDWSRMAKNAAEIFRASGFNENDILANCLSAGDLYGSFISFESVNQLLGITVLPFASVFSANSLLSVWKKIPFNAIQGMPSMIMPELRKAKQINPDFTIEKLMYAGMPMSEADRLWLRDVLGVRIVVSVIGTTEACQLAYQTPACPGSIHHLIDDYNYLEIVDDEGALLPLGSSGRIVVTTLQKRSFPLIRFAIGDRARIILHPDGAARQIEYLGRCDDVIAIGSMNASYGDFAAALKDLELGALQLVGRFHASAEMLVVNLETVSVPLGEVEQKARELIFSRVKEISGFCAQGKLFLEIHAFPPGTLPRNKRTGKLKLIVDERYHADATDSKE